MAAEDGAAVVTVRRELARVTAAVTAGYLIRSELRRRFRRQRSWMAEGVALARQRMLPAEKPVQVTVATWHAGIRREYVIRPGKSGPEISVRRNQW